MSKFKFIKKGHPDNSVTIGFVKDRPAAIEILKSTGNDPANYDIEEVKPCPYCYGEKPLRSEDNDYQRLIINDTDSVMEYEECVVKGTYMTEHGEEPNFVWKEVPFAINYCPICGRDLRSDEE